MSRRAVLGGAFGAAVAAGVTGCGHGSRTSGGAAPGDAGKAATGAASGQPAHSASPTAQPATVTAAGLDGDTVPFGAPVTLQSSTRLKAIKVLDADGKPVEGSLSAKGTSWTSAGLIGPGTSWTWTATTPKGAASGGTVTSAAATRTVRATANIGVNWTVGVAAPIVVKFKTKVVDKATVEKHLQVLVRPKGSKGAWRKATGSWAWLPDSAPNSELHFRTKKYWPAYSEVRVVLPLAQLDWGAGISGIQDFDWTFNVGRSQVVVADARKHNIVIYRDGKKVATYPASYGLESDPRRNTRTGINVVTEKLKTIEMKSKVFHYDEVEHWAVRFNNNGQFIHANPDTVQYQGKTNVSHGCINLSTKNGKAYFKTAIYGDPVDVRGTGVKLADTRTEIYDWALSWPQWQAMSALT